MIVRDARPDELPLIGELRVGAYRADGFLSAASEYASTLRALGADGDGEVLAAVDQGRIVGTVMLQHYRPSGEVALNPGEAEIRALAVSPAFRGRGIGRALLAAVTGLAAARGVRLLVLLTRPDMNVAQHLYAGAGFCRLPDRDWAPRPDLVLLAFGKVLSEDPMPPANVTRGRRRSG